MRSAIENHASLQGIHEEPNHEALIARRLAKRRRATSDARTYVLQLTDEGREMLALGLPALAQVEESLLEGLAATDKTHLVTSLRQILSDASPRNSGAIKS